VIFGGSFFLGQQQRWPFLFKANLFFKVITVKRSQADEAAFGLLKSVLVGNFRPGCPRSTTGASVHLFDDTTQIWINLRGSSRPSFIQELFGVLVHLNSAPRADHH
jgi:hypothetical protein